MHGSRLLDVRLALPIALSAIASAQATIHVPADQPTIEAALAAAQSGDTIEVAPGDYPRSNTFASYSFAGKNVHLRSTGGPSVTRLLPPVGMTGVVPMVLIANGEGPGAILEGFTIDSLNGSSSSLNTGIRIANASPTVRGCVVRNCKGLRGAALSIGQFGAPLIEDNLFVDNYANDQGGAVWITNASPMLRRNVLRANGAFNAGGGISVWGALTGPTTGVPVLDGNTLYGNYAATNHIGSRGGGVFVGFWNAAPSSSTVSTTIRNSIVWGNTAHADPGIVFNSMGTFTIDYTDTQESWGGTGNLVANPFFVDAANGDLNLQATSPCIDAGDPASPLDPDGTRADMGALPFQQCLPPTTYCTAKTNSQGCVPAVGSSGSPSATSSSPFTITATNVLNQKSGLLFYGFGSNAAPFQGGTMCVQPPVRRTPLQSSNGNAPPDDCSGSYAADFNAWTQSSSDPLLIAGAHVFVQFWSRDPASPSTTGLTDALSFWICQ